MRITREWIHSCSTSPLTGAFDKEQLRLLGREKTKGWLSGLIGTEIPDEIALKIEKIGEMGRSRIKYMIPTVMPPE